MQAQWNESLAKLKGPLSDPKLNKDKSWRSEGFVANNPVPIFGTGRLVISVGRMSTGHKVSMFQIDCCQKLI
jgi:hypothetical protein